MSGTPPHASGCSGWCKLQGPHCQVSCLRTSPISRCKLAASSAQCCPLITQHRRAPPPSYLVLEVVNHGASGSQLRQRQRQVRCCRIRPHQVCARVQSRHLRASFGVGKCVSRRPLGADRQQPRSDAGTGNACWLPAHLACGAGRRRCTLLHGKGHLGQPQVRLRGWVGWCKAPTALSRRST